MSGFSRRPLAVEHATRNTLSRQLYSRGWSDQDLARASGLSRLRVNRLKNRRARPTVREALMLSAALGVRIEQIFFLAIAPVAPNGVDGPDRPAIETVEKAPSDRVMESSQLGAGLPSSQRRSVSRNA